MREMVAVGDAALERSPAQQAVRSRPLRPPGSWIGRVPNVRWRSDQRHVQSEHECVGSADGGIRRAPPHVAKSPEDFVRDNHDVCDGGDDDERLRQAAHRQQMLSTMLLMGINRIVVTDGKISASATPEFRPRRPGARS